MTVDVEVDRLAARISPAALIGAVVRRFRCSRCRAPADSVTLANAYPGMCQAVTEYRLR
jgi:hypothetical protein